MTIDNILNYSITQAIIYLKNGKRIYGVLIDTPLKYDDFQFIYNYNIGLFKETNNSSFIEAIPRNSIESIDTNLK